MLSDHHMTWNFHNPTRVHFGVDSRKALAGLLAGQRLLVVSTERGRGQFSADPVLGGIDAELVWVDSVTQNPGLAETQIEIDRLAGQRFDSVLAFGGGSAMDAAKALAAALAPEAGTRDLAALIAEPGRHLCHPVLPVDAVTTTSGTGAEVTPFATIWDHGARRKLSLASPRLFPRTAVVDPVLTYGLPHAATVSTGLDALNQAFESVWNRNRSPVTLLMAGRAIGLALRAMPRLVEDLGDQEARAGIAEASLLAGLCISQTRTAICHSISYPLTAHFDVPHGLACAFSMGAVARAVLEGAPDVLGAVAGAAGHSSPDALVDALEAVLKRCAVRKTVAAAITGAPDAVLALRGEMFTPGRADNFILPVDERLLVKVIDTSLGMI